MKRDEETNQRTYTGKKEDCHADEARVEQALKSALGEHDFLSPCQLNPLYRQPCISQSEED
jgi:hypothetical protein